SFLQDYRDVAGPLTHQVGATAGAREGALEGRAVAHLDLLDEQPVVEHVVVVDGVGPRALEELEDGQRGATVGEAKDRFGLRYVLAADEVGDQAGLARRDAQHPE